VSNVLKPENREQIKALGRLGWSLRRIQKETGIRRETISSYLKEAGIELRPPRARHLPSKPASHPQRVITDSGGENDTIETRNPDSNPSKPASPAGAVITDSSDIQESSAAPQPTRSPSSSTCEPFRDVIELGLSRGRNAKAIWQDLVDTYDFAASYQSVRRFIHQTRGRQTPEACAVIETPAGEEAQVDYGAGPMIRDPQTGKYRRSRLFVLTLGYSRKSVRLLVFRSSSQTWAELHEKAFRRLGGSVRTIVLDNLREGVLSPDIYDPTINPLYRDLLKHYGTIPLPCRVHDPDRKAYVSYCTLFLLRNDEDWLFGPPASVALENRALVEWFVQATPRIVVTMLLQSALSGPKVDCSSSHVVPSGHLFRSEQTLSP